MDSDDPTVVHDVVMPNEMDNQYYKIVLSCTVLFTSDAALMTLPETAKMVMDNASIPGPGGGRTALYALVVLALLRSDVQ
ncbi:hypothetical protein EJB05_06457, partial [Eragrostis curvula]